MSLLLSSCTPTQPVTKIGLIAPFEGLYRRNGYEALAAVRAAIADHPVAGVGMMPVALDDSGNPELARRALAKLRVDPAVGAIVGPLAPGSAVAVVTTWDTAPVLWFLPLPSDMGLAASAPAPGREGWATGLVKRAAELAADQGADGLVLAGWTPGWPEFTPEAWTAYVGIPVRQAEDPTQVQAGEAVFWMGSPDGGAAYLAALRRRQPEAPFWMGPQGGDPVFVERAQTFDKVYWVIWSDPGYTGWTTTHTPSSPAAYLVYRATADAIGRMSGGVQAAEAWFVQAYVLGRNGVSERYPPMP